MYKKIARIGPISFGIFYALLTLLTVIIHGFDRRVRSSDDPSLKECRRNLICSLK